ncbi:MAG: 3'-5' exonuclease [Clostridia bacterium]|nr:3'-5' exonuclease [Clostridia bacterium]
MKILAFDIECAMVSKTAAHILSFGYVLTDEHFTVLEKDDILINPCTKIRVQAKSGEGIVLPYTDKMLRKMPKFPAVYERIKSLIEAPDTIVIGHSTMNDVRYLNLDCAKYNLPPLCFRFWDTQVLAAEEAGDFNALRGLNGLATELGVTFQAHCSMEDAEMTLFVFQKMCEKAQLSPCELLAANGGEAGTSANYEAYTATTAAFREVLKERAKKKEERRLAWERKQKRLAKAGEEGVAKAGEEGTAKSDAAIIVQPQN